MEKTIHENSNSTSKSPSSAPTLFEFWSNASFAEKRDKFAALSRVAAEDFFLSLDSDGKAEVLLFLINEERRAWIRLLPPDDAVDLLQHCPLAQRSQLMEHLDEPTRREVTALLAYAEDDAGGLMNPRFARVRPDMSIEEAIRYLRRQSSRDSVEYIYYIYVLDADQCLQGIISFRELFMAPGNCQVKDIMRTDIITVPEEMDQEHLSQLFAQHDLGAIPVVDKKKHLKGIVTIDDIVDVVQEEATEDIQKIGATSALGAPYLKVSVLQMIRKRGIWLAVLFVGEMFTATAMGYFEHEIVKAVVLALFIPLIISSGGNSGSQASTLIIRAMVLGEVRLRDWWRIVTRELVSGFALGSMLGLIGLLRIVLWPTREALYGEHYLYVGLTVAASLIGVVTFGTLVGSMLPLLLKKCNLDPASASAPLVATLVDVTGLVIYFVTASIILSGKLL